MPLSNLKGSSEYAESIRGGIHCPALLPIVVQHGDYRIDFERVLGCRVKSFASCNAEGVVIEFDCV